MNRPLPRVLEIITGEDIVLRAVGEADAPRFLEILQDVCVFVRLKRPVDAKPDRTRPADRRPGSSGPEG